MWYWWKSTWHSYILGLELLHKKQALQSGDVRGLRWGRRLWWGFALWHQQLWPGRPHRWRNNENIGENYTRCCSLGYLDCCYRKRCSSNNHCSALGMVRHPFIIWLLCKLRQFLRFLLGSTPVLKAYIKIMATKCYVIYTLLSNFIFPIQSFPNDNEIFPN